MDLLFIFGLSTEAYANLLVYGGIALFIVVGIPLCISASKLLDELNESSFDPIKYIMGIPQFNLPKDTEIIITINKEKANDSEQQDAQTEPDTPEPSEPQDAQTEPDAPEQSEPER